MKSNNEQRASAQQQSQLVGGKKPWLTPGVVVENLDETETGVDIGPEILVLIS